MIKIVVNLILCFFVIIFNLYFQDGQVTVDEFKQAVQNACVGKGYDNFPGAFKSFIANQFKTVDVNGM